MPPSSTTGPRIRFTVADVPPPAARSHEPPFKIVVQSNWENVTLHMLKFAPLSMVSVSSAVPWNLTELPCATV